MSNFKFGVMFFTILMLLASLVAECHACEGLEETESVVTLYDGNVLYTSELRLESGRVLIHTYLASGQEGWISLHPENVKNVATPEGWLVINEDLSSFTVVPFGGEDMVAMGIL